jgi:hypothetical protein
LVPDWKDTLMSRRRLAVITVTLAALAGGLAPALAATSAAVVPQVAATAQLHAGPDVTWT